MFLEVSLHAQENNKDAIEGYVTFDEVVGIENTNLSQGLLYIEQYRTINEKKQFFKSSNFEKGSVWYSKQPYYGKFLKYDAHHDELLVQLQSLNSQQQATLQLIKADVDSFDIGQHRFIKLKPITDSQILNDGFYESLFQDISVRLYVKHSKKKIERKGARSVYYEFVDFKKQYLLYKNGTFYDLNSKKEFGEALGITKKELNRLYKKFNKGTKNQDTFILELVKQKAKGP